MLIVFKGVIACLKHSSLLKVNVLSILSPSLVDLGGISLAELTVKAKVWQLHGFNLLRSFW